MTTAQLNKQIGDIVEQKLLEFFGDPDAGLEVKKSLLVRIRKEMKKKNRRLTPLSEVAKMYGLNLDWRGRAKGSQRNRPCNQ